MPVARRQRDAEAFFLRLFANPLELHAPAEKAACPRVIFLEACRLVREHELVRDLLSGKDAAFE
jgi:hypothetical protein